jgi:ubiquitin-like 1-activating enzyme E1 B
MPPFLYCAEGGSEAASTAEDPIFYRRRHGEGSRLYAQRVFRQLYCTKIEELQSMEDLWTNRPPPQPLDLDAILASADDGAAQCPAPVVDASGSACKALGLDNAHAVWAVRDNALVFLQAIEMFLDSRTDELGSAQVRASGNSCV